MNRLLSKIGEGLTSPRIGAELLLRNVAARFMSDKAYIQTQALLRFGHTLDLKDPKTFNEKMNWLKLYDRNPLYTKLADKYAVKDFVKEKIGEDFVVPCYGVWDHFDQIDFEMLPASFVLKCTHDSSGVVICKDKLFFDKASSKLRIERCLRKNNFYHSREWVYKGIPHKIIADMYLDDGSGHELRDYKFWCFNGEPQYMYCTNKASDIFENFYDMDFKPVNINHGFRRQKPEFECPKEFNLMKQLAAELSKDIPFVRVDFFYVNGHVYFGEFTFYDWGGMRPFHSENDDIQLGKFITLNGLE